MPIESESGEGLIIRYIQMEKFLKSVTTLEEQCKKRGIEKLDATGKGFGKFNNFDGMNFNPDGVEVRVIDGGYDLRDEANVSLNIDEIIMTEKAWNAYLEQLKADRKREEEAEKSRKEMNEKELRKQKYLKLKQEFEQP